MYIHEKLDFLMNITKGENSRLAQYISIDSNNVHAIKSKRQSVFYGIEGKREAVLNFLSLISIQESLAYSII